MTTPSSAEVESPATTPIMLPMPLVPALVFAEELPKLSSESKGEAHTTVLVDSSRRVYFDGLTLGMINLRQVYTNSHLVQMKIELTEVLEVENLLSHENGEKRINLTTPLLSPLTMLN